MRKVAAKYAALAKRFHAQESSHVHGSVRQDTSFMDDDWDDVDEETEFEIAVETAAAYDRMAQRVATTNARQMRDLGIDLRRDVRAQGHIRAARQKNIDLVQQTRKGLRQELRSIFDRPEVWGIRPEDLAEEIADRVGVSISRATLIARDQTLRLNRDVTAARQQDAGVEKFVWSTSKDERVRDEHAALEGHVFSWDDPPEEISDINCRCVQLPLLPEAGDEDSE